MPFLESGIIFFAVLFSFFVSSFLLLKRIGRKATLARVMSELTVHAELEPAEGLVSK